MDAFEVWAYRGLIALLLVVLWYVVRKFTSNISFKFNQITEKIDVLIEAIRGLGETNVAHEERIKSIQKSVDDHTKRLNDHSKRIREIEIKQGDD